MIIFNEKEKNCLRKAIKLAEERRKFYEQHSQIISPQNRVLNEEDKFIIDQYNAVKHNFDYFLNELENKMLYFLLCVMEIGGSSQDYMYESHRERFNACQTTLNTIGLSKQDVIAKLRQFHLGKSLYAGVQHLGNTIE